MPQFDISSFIVQLFWLFISFISFYLVFSWKYLPSWAFLLKARKKIQNIYADQSIIFENYSLINIIKLSEIDENTKNQIYF